MSKRVLVYPCGTEIGLEIHKAAGNSIHFDLFGGSSSYDHGRFVYEKHIGNLHFIDDSSQKADIERFASQIDRYDFDFIYPAMDGVLTKFSEFRECFKGQVIAPPCKTAKITRSKKKTYGYFAGLLEVPKIIGDDTEIPFPVFVKPDVGQGARGTALIRSEKELALYKSLNGAENLLILEYLPGEEYTIDCFTNSSGDLVYFGGRVRRRVKSGISVNAVRAENKEFKRIAEIINANLELRGAWFFQLKENSKGQLSLLEIAPRIAGGSALTRNYGVNLPLLTLHLFDGQIIDSILLNNYELELDRALQNSFSSTISFSRVYIDFDDTLILRGKINLQVVAFLFQCINDGVPITLLTRTKVDIGSSLEFYRIKGLFDDVIFVSETEKKSQYIKEKDAIFIDDSYGERAEVRRETGINVFDTHMIECLLHR